MFCIEYEVKDSAIDTSGKGVFAVNAIPPGKVLVAPDRISDICHFDELQDEKRASTSVRWFEDICNVEEGERDEFFFNHSFSANSLWHLGFIFALRPIRAGEEITLDYGHLLGDGFVAFTDSETGKEVAGLPWREALRIQLEKLQATLAR